MSKLVDNINRNKITRDRWNTTGALIIDEGELPGVACQLI